MSRYPPIESHGVIGDLQTAALVGMDGCIDFLCLPVFDSPSVFASLLDHDRGGYFQLQPVLDEANHKQLYLPDTNVLLTRFLSAEGVGEISDFMAIHDEPHPSRVVRQALEYGDMASVHRSIRANPPLIDDPDASLAADIQVQRAG